MTGYETPSSACTRSPDEIGADGFSSSSWPEQFPAARGGGGGGAQGGRRRLLEEGRGGGYKSLGLGDGFGSGPTGPGPTGEHSVHPHHRDFIVTPIADQIGRIDSVSKTEYYDLKKPFFRTPVQNDRFAPQHRQITI
ncbi:hypothetical protein F511_44180 [Dorcoceras hygrometricum]|uniref:Uncharacterized protein n=1 Tax=Dorcoceras hygrometricum TaxID=472368 RepID=A0A2Z7BDE5_9LAMI|nr:hypothetical protein F511_44180 [Dorcoceras hygrometricum]